MEEETKSVFKCNQLMVPSQNQSWMCQWFVSVGIWMCRTGINRYKLCLRSVNLCFYAAAVLSQPDLRSTCSSVYLNLTVCSSDHRCSFWWENSQLLLPQLFLILVMFPLLWLAEDTIKTEVLDDSDFQVFQVRPAEAESHVCQCDRHRIKVIWRWSADHWS